MGIDYKEAAAGTKDDEPSLDLQELVGLLPYPPSDKRSRKMLVVFQRIDEHQLTGDTFVKFVGEGDDGVLEIRVHPDKQDMLLSALHKTYPEVWRIVPNEDKETRTKIQQTLFETDE